MEPVDEEESAADKILDGSDLSMELEPLDSEKGGASQQSIEGDTPAKKKSERSVFKLPDDE